MHSNQFTGDSGVDTSTQAVLRFDGSTAVMDCSLQIPESAGLHIVGTKAAIEIPQPWFPHLEPRFWLIDRDGRRTLIESGHGDSYALQVGNFCRAVAGLEAPKVLRDLSRRIAVTLELIAASAVTTATTTRAQVS